MNVSTLAIFLLITISTSESYKRIRISRYDSFPSCSSKLYQSALAQSLLAVDLGLRTGIAIFNSSGNLIDYSYYHFKSFQFLENDLIEFFGNISANHSTLSHFALEGDKILQDIWKTAISNYFGDSVSIIAVLPIEWRSRMLIPRESTSSRAAKTASREISRQIIWKSGLTNTNISRPMNTDTSEAILMGYYVVIDKLKWGSQPLKSDVYYRSDKSCVSLSRIVDRYTNGNVILPIKQSNTR